MTAGVRTDVAEAWTRQVVIQLRGQAVQTLLRWAELARAGKPAGELAVAQALGRSRWTVARHFQQAQQLGLLEVTRGASRYGGKEYEAVLPEGCAA